MLPILDCNCGKETPKPKDCDKAQYLDDLTPGELVFVQVMSGKHLRHVKGKIVAQQKGYYIQTQQVSGKLVQTEKGVFLDQRSIIQ